MQPPNSIEILPFQNRRSLSLPDRQLWFMPQLNNTYRLALHNIRLLPTPTFISKETVEAMMAHKLVYVPLAIHVYTDVMVVDYDDAPLFTRKDKNPIPVTAKMIRVAVALGQLDQVGWYDAPFHNKRRKT